LDEEPMAAVDGDKKPDSVETRRKPRSLVIILHFDEIGT
jgi:hypothetical protein